MSQPELRVVNTDTNRPYHLSEAGMEVLRHAGSTLLLLGILSVEHDSATGGVPAEELGDTLLMLARQLKHVMTECVGGAV